MSENKSTILGGKAWYESLTAWGAIIFGAISGAEAGGVVPTGTGAQSSDVVAQIATLAQSIGALLMALGIRRATNK